MFSADTTTATSSGGEDAAAKDSLRQRLKKMSPDVKLLQYLDEIKVGYLNTREQRVKVARRLTPTRSREEKWKEKSQGAKQRTGPSTKREVRPFPFKKPGWVIGTAEQWTADDAAKLYDAPYVAVIGRSNVGKSTLVNTLVNYDFSFVQRAKVSATPGETKALTLYGLGKLKEVEHKREEGITEVKINPALVLADLPGYGFAFMNDDSRQRCEDLTNDFFLRGQFDPANARSLKRILLLLDARHGMKASDRQFLQELSAKVEAGHKAAKGELGKAALKKLSWKVQIVLTKCDLVERVALCRQMMLLKEDYAELVPPKLQSDLPIVPLSGRDSSGVTALQQELSALVPPLPAIEDEPEPAPPAKSDKKGAEKGARDPKGAKRGDLRSGGGDPKAKRGDGPADRRLARDAKPDRASRPKNGGDKEKAPQDKWSRDKPSDAAADRRRDKGRDSRDDAGDATKKRPTAKGSPSTRGASPSKGSVKGRWDAELKAEVFLDDEGFAGDDFGADDEPRPPAGRGRREAASPRSAWKGSPVSSKAQPQRSSSTDSRKAVDKLRRRSPRTAKVHAADAEEAPLRRRVSSMDQYAMSLLRETRETGDRSPADNKEATPTETRRGRAPLGQRRRVTRARKTPSAGDAADEGA
eukprot:gene2801-2036_t